MEDRAHLNASASQFWSKIPVLAMQTNGAMRSQPRTDPVLTARPKESERPQQPTVAKSQLLGAKGRTGKTRHALGYGQGHGQGHGDVFEPEPGHIGRIGLLEREGMPRMPPTTWQSWQLHQLQLHNSGQCFPCIAFALKPAGCFKGDECRHCHFCNAEQAKARRRQLQQAARRQKRRRGKVQVSK
eukprot:s1255_g32.t1